MKRNMFNEAIAQPGDDLGMVLEEHGIDACATMRVQEGSIDEDPNFGWSAVLEDEDFNEVQVHDFDSEAAIRAYLIERNVEGL